MTPEVIRPGGVVIRAIGLLEAKERRGRFDPQKLMEMGFHGVLNLRGGVMGGRAQLDSSLPAY